MMISIQWFWVKINGEWSHPAYKDKACAGGWTNGDTWEDFDNQVEDWIVIKAPDKYEKGGDSVQSPKILIQEVT